MGFDIRKKGKNVKAEEFMKEMKDRHKETKAALMKSQKEMKKQAEKYRVGDKVLISTKDFPMEWMKRLTRKLTEKYIRPYVVKRTVSENTVELEFPAVMRVHPVVNMRRIVKY